ncbi:MAG: chemotaxis response regulator protein-glutamate methylesterase [Gammaproteobacteria bacterium]|nr:chemotaxis response regulator protein-glutamate methylesterase [Gammaproteobacteria bacterium]
MRIGIVNDSALAVEALRQVVISVPEYSVAWIAHDGAESVWRCTQERPDLILMDLIMPVMDGVEATRRIMEHTPCPIVVVTATVEGNASKVFQAMGAGALDAVNTPVLGADGEGEGKKQLLSKISTIARLIRSQKTVIAHAQPMSSSIRRVMTSNEKLVAIGASSGGPQALAKVLSGLSADFPAPVVIVQHVDQKFSQELAEWLNNQCCLEVRLAQAGDTLKKGRVLIAGNNDHLILKADRTLAYTPDPIDQPYRPSVDVFFNSLVQYWTGDLIAVLLTGMGRDGAQGLLQLRNKGVHTIAQNEATCAVYGMPKAAVQLNAAVEVLPIDEISKTLVQYFSGSLQQGMRV